MLKQYKAVLIIAMFAPVMMVFQNCSSAIDFSSSDGSGLVSKVGDDDIVGDLDLDTPPPSEDDDETTPPTTPPTTQEEPDVSEPLPPVVSDDEDDDDADDHPGKGKDKDNDNDGDDSQNYICVLEGPGQSQILHFAQSLSSSVSTIDAVCTSKSACEDLVSQKFDVKFAKDAHGRCKNPHTVHLDDDQIASLLGL